MKIRNPNFVPEINAEAAHVKHREAVLSVLRSDPEKEFFTFTEIRGALALTKSALPDGSIAQICQDAGIETAD